MLWKLNFSHSLKNWVIPFISEKNLDYISNIIWYWSYFRKINKFVINFLDVSDFIEYASILLKISSDNILSLRSVKTCTLLYSPVSC